MTGWIDITMPLGHPGGTWPGDTEFEMQWTQVAEKGSSAVNLSRFTTSPHNGTHADAPVHVQPGGPASQDLPIDAFIGPAQVVDADGPGTTVRPEDLESVQFTKGQRVLMRTHGKRPQNTFPKRFRGLDPEAVDLLADWECPLVGTDAPSVDAYDSQGLPAHRRLIKHGMTWVENLDLSKAPPGEYEMVALPILVPGLCAAPVRALLRPAD